MTWQLRLSATGICCLLLLLIHGGHATSGGDNAAVQRADQSPSGNEAQELEAIRRQREEYQKLTRQVASRLRRFQGIAEQHFAQVPGEQSSPDVRLSGARISGLLGESATPKTITLAEEEWIRLAGDIRAAECSNLLLNRIADPREKLPVNARSLVPSDFTLEALRQIGQPACREAVKRIPVEPDKRRREKMVCLLQVVLGNYRARSELVRVQMAASGETQAERLAQAIAQIEANSTEPQ